MVRKTATRKSAVVVEVEVKGVGRQDIDVRVGRKTSAGRPAWLVVRAYQFLAVGLSFNVYWCEFARALTLLGVG